MTKILTWIHSLVWGVPALVLILGVGLYFSLRTRFAQLRLLPKALKQMFAPFRPGRQQPGTVSPFRALCTALAATVGTGNLAGVAGAITIGGPGAVFWMWVSGVLGMVTKMAEAALAVRYRVKRDNGEIIGGPMYMIRQGMGKRFHFLAWIYSFFGLVAAFGVGNAAQINALLGGINTALTAFGGRESLVGNMLMGSILALLVGVMLLGGAKRIGAAAETLVPFASVGYLLLCVWVLVMRRDRLPDAVYAIFCGAFSPRGFTGGMIGSAFTALRVGISRGVFTNEAGMGTAAMAHASAEVEHPMQQGLMGIAEVFLDTIVICTMTALVILCSGVPIPYGEDTGISLTGAAFRSVCGDWVTVVIALFLALFALATVLGWGLYGVRCAEYLFGSRGTKTFVFFQIFIVAVSAAAKTGTVWLLCEIVNGLMAIPNLIALAALSPELVRLLQEYQSKYGGKAASGGTYENFHQCQPLRAFSHAKVPSVCRGGGAAGKDHLSSEHRSAGSAHPGGVLRCYPEL